MTTSKFAALAMSICSLACSVREDVFAPNSLSWEHLAAVQEAADEWCEESGGRACPVIDSAGSSKISEVARFESEHSGAVGLCTVWTDGTSRIRILQELTREETRLVALHEFGHHFGCFDNDDPSSVMNRYIEQTAPHLSISDLGCALSDR